MPSFEQYQATLSVIRDAVGEMPMRETREAVHDVADVLAALESLARAELRFSRQLDRVSDAARRRSNVDSILYGPAKAV